MLKPRLMDEQIADTMLRNTQPRDTRIETIHIWARGVVLKATDLKKRLHG